MKFEMTITITHDGETWQAGSNVEILPADLKNDFLQYLAQQEVAELCRRVASQIEKQTEEAEQ